MNEDELRVRADERAKTILEFKLKMESIADAYEDLARLHPTGPDKVKAAALRRFAEVYLG